MRPVKQQSPHNHRKVHDQLVAATVDIVRMSFARDPVWCWPTKTQATYNPDKGGWVRGQTYKGPGDITCVVGGLHVELECKTGKGVLTAGQKEHAGRLDGAGGCHHVVRDPETAVEIVAAALESIKGEG